MSAKQEVARSLNVQVDTFDTAGQMIGTRVVDMYHYGTKAWLTNHTWWAMHNGHFVNMKTMETLTEDQFKAQVIKPVELVAVAA